MIWGLFLAKAIYLDEATGNVSGPAPMSSRELGLSVSEYLEGP